MSNINTARVPSSTTSASIDDTINHMIHTAAYGKQNANTKKNSDASNASNASKAEFIACSTFQGAKPGYYFGTRADIGLGYHLDHYNSNLYQTEGISQAQTQAQTQTQTQTPSRKRRKKTGEELLAEAEDQITSSTSLDDISGIKSATLSLEKCIQKNQIHRAQNPDTPEKFMESEIALNDEITAWKAVAASTSLEFYPHVVKLGTIQSILNLINHENNDVAISVISLLAELIDVDLINSVDPTEKDNLDRSKHHMAILVNEFLNEGGLDLVVQNIGRLDEVQDHEATGVDDTLTLIETLLDMDAMGILLTLHDNHEQSNMKSIVLRLLTETSFLSWLFDRIHQKEFNPIKLHATEILATLLQHEDAAPFTNHLDSIQPYSSHFSDEDDTNPNTSKTFKTPPNTKKQNQKPKPKSIDGIEILLQAVANYRKKNPTTEEECEFLENCFHSLSAAMLHAHNVKSFLDAQGPELMLRCIREKVHSGGSSLRVLYFVLSGSNLSSNSASSSGSSSNNQSTEKHEDVGSNDHQSHRNGINNNNNNNNNLENIYQKACEHFIHVGGLSVLFPLFMGRKSAIPRPAQCSDAGKNDLAKKAAMERHTKSKTSTDAATISKRAKRAYKAKKEWIRQIESNSIRILYCLTRHIHAESPHDARDRLVVKFVEHDCEKCDRLVELCLKYDERMRLAEARYYRSEAAEEAELDGIDVDLAAFHEKLKGGGDLFHCVGAICAFVSVESKRCHEHIIEQLKVKNSGISLVKAATEEFASILDEGKQKSQLLEYLTLI